MANTVIQLKFSTETGNVPTSLANGEISINNRDGKFFYSTPANVVITHYPYPGPAGLNTEIQFNDSGVLGSDSDLSFNKTTDILSAKNIVISGNSYFGNANLHEGITQLSVTNSGASAYLFDQYSGNNPSLYVGAGETLSFNLNVSGHPFVIRETSGGANTSAGLTHISTTGVVSTGADAQGKVSGILFWKVPFSLVGSTYVYQCTIHGGMVGNIVIQQPASFVAANTTLAFNTANAAFLAANAATATDTTQNNSITAAFAAANAATATNLTQNNSITAAFTRANNSLDANNGGTVTGTITANSFITTGSFGNILGANTIFANNFVANTGFIQFADGSKQFTANAGSGGTTDDYARNTANASFVTANSAGVYANGAFARANNSLNANTGGTVTANVTISANLTASNVATQTYIQFGDGSKQFTANAGSGGGTTDTFARNQANSAFIHANSAFNVANTGSGAANSFGQIVANVGTILATSSNDSLQIVGESGISVSSNVSAKKVIVSVPAGFTFTTADYGFVTDSTNVIFDYGTL